MNAAGGLRSYPLFAEAREAGGKQTGRSRKIIRTSVAIMGGKEGSFSARESANGLANSGAEAFWNWRAALRRLG